VTWRDVSYSSHRSVNLRCEILFFPSSIEQIYQTQVAFSPHLAAASPAIDNLRYLGGATTWLGRERLARCGLEVAGAKSALWMEGKTDIPHSKLTER